MKWLKRILAGLTILFLVFLLFNFRMDFRTSDTKTAAYFKKRQLEANIFRIPYNNDFIRVVETINPGIPDSAPVILFVHGAPGSADNFYKYQCDSLLLKRARLVSMDRPGYGYSQFGKAEVSISRQAEAVRTVMGHYPGRQFILVGHSFGGPIIAKVAMDNPSGIKSLLMLAPVNDPDHEPMFWFSSIPMNKWFRWLFGPAWIVSSEEKMAHASELATIAAGWKNLSVPVVHMHGDKDSLAPPVNMDFSKRNIPAPYLKMVHMPKAGHLIPFLNYEAVREELLEGIGSRE